MNVQFFVSSAKHSGTKGLLFPASVHVSVGLSHFLGSHMSLCFAGDICSPWNAAILVFTLIFFKIFEIFI